ncbi:MAG: recombination mediator RecR [Thermodesulfobacteriota bacterium]
MSYAAPIEKLIREFSRLPGIGEKTATRLAFHVLNGPQEYASGLAQSITNIKEKVHQCSVCCNLSDRDPCDLCSDGGRSQSVVCVVEDVNDLAAIEATGGFRGVYHILHGCLSPLKGIGPDDIRIAEFIRRVESGGIEEVILAMSPNMEGEATALYITRLLKPVGIRVTRIAVGIPVGGELEYMDGVTIGKAFEGRREM